MVPLAEDIQPSQEENMSVRSRGRMGISPSKRRRSIPAAYIVTPHPDIPEQPKRSYSLMRQSSMPRGAKRRRTSRRPTQSRSQSPAGSNIPDSLPPSGSYPAVLDHPPLVTPLDAAPGGAVLPPHPIDTRSPYSCNFESSFDPRSSTYHFIHSVIHFSEPILPRLDFRMDLSD
ncbi:hypothetical protein FRB96_002529 [Tulasnella sp. 330]|nr:hypothetical protein FRB96_002529 [Tulasnella sp. 330]KAG8876955.1 hypothetical protein FRB97_003799 [Tulasnella sp. 331]KAG8885740.1 hypothetical protein FRB98_001652 [Tulasnella sp. 332]